MNRNSIPNELPLITALLELNTAGRSSWHMPGHRNGRQWPDWLIEKLHLLDTTELAGSDDLLNPTGPALKSLEQAAFFCSSAWSRYLTAGSTSGILSMIAACVGRKGRILVSRTCHQSVMHAAALLDLEIGWIESTLLPEKPKGASSMTLLPQSSADDVRRAAGRFGNYSAVLITSPDYYGSCADISQIAAEVHGAGAVLLVDEAHGAHFSAGSDRLPSSAMTAGADICVQSVHKTLPALSSAALIHISREAVETGRISTENVEACLKIFHTSSPSFLIAATTEYALAWMNENGKTSIDNTIELIKKLTVRFGNRLIFAPVDKLPKAGQAERDPLRIIISLACGSPVKCLAESLGMHGIDIEMQDLFRLILIPALDQTQQEFNELADALEWSLDSCCLDGKLDRNDRRLIAELTDIDSQWRFMMGRAPDIVISPGDIMFGNIKKIILPPDQAAGMISASAIIPYPPGIPLVWPGELLTAEKLAFIRKLSENGVNLTGLANKNLHVVG